MSDREADAVRASLEGWLPGWQVWSVRLYSSPLGLFSWSAMPVGAGRAAASDYSPDGLLSKASEFQAALSFHIERTRKELADTDSALAPRREMLEADLKSFEQLASLIGSN